jgi:hypothetical protein
VPISGNTVASDSLVIKSPQSPHDCSTLSNTLESAHILFLLTSSHFNLSIHLPQSLLLTTRTLLIPKRETTSPLIRPRLATDPSTTTRKQDTPQPHRRQGGRAYRTERESR